MSEPVKELNSKNSFEEFRVAITEQFKQASTTEDRDALIKQLNDVNQLENSNKLLAQKNKLELERFYSIEQAKARNETRKLYFNMATAILLIILGAVLYVYDQENLGLFLVGGGLTRIGLKGYVDTIINTFGKKLENE